ncbi:MAG: Uma2 family endonuclease [Saprospiraceae bacterium]|nr:Uma2 family endonuclease [Saprospiraceae bacterium]
MVKFLKTHKAMTAEEYLAHERATLREKGGKHEFFNGKLIEMAGASYNHNRIVKNVAISLEKQFEQYNTNHEATLADTKVVSFLSYKNYFYPDIVIVDGKPLYADDFRDIVANPQILIEVLSESTAAFDRGEKFQSYRNIKSLQECILIDSEKPCIEQYYRDETERWQFGDVVSEGSLTFYIAPFQLNIEDVYRKVDFEAED